jgi:hypothetical protein
MFKVVYYESIKRELQRKPTSECRCDERLKTKTEESTHIVYTGSLGDFRGTGTPKDNDEVNRREVCECDGSRVKMSRKNYEG